MPLHPVTADRLVRDLLKMHASGAINLNAWPAASDFVLEWTCRDFIDQLNKHNATIAETN